MLSGFNCIHNLCSSDDDEEGGNLIVEYLEHRAKKEHT